MTIAVDLGRKATKKKKKKKKKKFANYSTERGQKEEHVKNIYHIHYFREHSSSVVECLTQDRMVAVSSLTSNTALCP